MSDQYFEDEETEIEHNAGLYEPEELRDAAMRNIAKRLHRMIKEINKPDKEV
jgi:hypothetical protein